MSDDTDPPLPGTPRSWTQAAEHEQRQRVHHGEPFLVFTPVAEPRTAVALQVYKPTTDQLVLALRAKPLRQRRRPYRRQCGLYGDRD